MRRKPARSYLSSLYSRMSKAAQAGMRRLRSRANRAGPEHLAADAREFDYIEREARDILEAVARLRARDAAEVSGVFELPPETMPITEWAPDVTAPPMLDYVEEPMPETRATGNMVRGLRRRNMAGGVFHVYGPSGFESGHRSLAAAEKAARSASLRHGEQRVYAADRYGTTGPNAGHEVSRFVGGRKV